jgi:hypothetical protein
MSSLGNFKVYILLKASSNSRFLDECTEWISCIVEHDTLCATQLCCRTSHH